MEKSLHTLYCPICGHTKIESLAWLDSNTRDFHKWHYDDLNDETDWCCDCREHIQAKSLTELWADFAEIDVDEDDNIVSDFMCFPAGTSKFDVWHWFDERCPRNLHDDLLCPSEREIRRCDNCGKPMKEGYYLGGEYACSDECALVLYHGDKAQMEEDLSHAEEDDAECYWTQWESIYLDD